MRVHNLYVDDKGETHFRDIEVAWVEERNATKYSKRLPATGIMFGEASSAYDLDWQCAPKAGITTGGRFHPESCRLIWKLTSGSAG